MPVDHDAIATAVVLAMKNAIGPLVAELAEIRLDLARLDARPPVPGPPGPAGEPGARGADGLGFDDFGVVHDGDRTIALRFSRGGESKEFSAVLPFPRFRGEYQPGTVYTVGDVIRHAGSAWHCNAATVTAPADGRDEWSLFVRKGRDGRDSTGRRS